MTLSFHSYSRGRSSAAFGPLVKPRRLICNLKIRIDSQVLIDSHHARHVADRAEHRAFLAPGMNATPELNCAIFNLDANPFSFALSAPLECFFNFIAQLFLIDEAWNDGDLVGNADDTCEL